MTHDDQPQVESIETLPEIQAVTHAAVEIKHIIDRLQAEYPEGPTAQVFGDDILHLTQALGMAVLLSEMEDMGFTLDVIEPEEEVEE